MSDKDRSGRGKPCAYKQLLKAKEERDQRRLQERGHSLLAAQQLRDEKEAAEDQATSSSQAYSWESLSAEEIAAAAVEAASASKPVDPQAMANEALREMNRVDGAHATSQTASASQFEELGGLGMPGYHRVTRKEAARAEREGFDGTDWQGISPTEIAAARRAEPIPQPGKREEDDWEEVPEEGDSP
ncbi:hypothetical protein BT63DRAFT_460940 [Microthyrium microscopicum]|uniref:Uncharacterized protein n=1 Tax=Microthyrium microscopicum TaxID=703497 RepID=A0A6A6TY88_9PEZI|nr:hypothetical protein BT63DRAFT_460940 [Microthyrium microscopicum]